MNGTILTEVRPYIDGAWRETAERAPIVSPIDGATLVHVHQVTLDDVDSAIAAARRASESWASTPAHRRAQVIAAIADGVEARVDDFAAQMTAETGRPTAEARGEIVRSISTLRISAEEATRITGELIAMDAVASGEGKLGYTVLTPVGVVAAITPFNAPINTICHKLGPALAGGNTLVLKPHHHGAGIAALLVEVCSEAGVPEGCFQLVHGGPDVGRHLTTHPDVDFVNFTGSGKVAETIVREIGLRRSLLELGGNAPTIVHHDADLDKAARLCAEAGFGLSGQSCISTQRIYVHEQIRDQFTSLLVALAEERSHLTEPGVPGGIGPMISEEAAVRVEDWVNEAVQEGAQLLCGGGRKFTFVEPTVLTDAQSTSKVVCEEIFGPVVVILPYRDIDEAIVAANDSPWGLKAGIFTTDLNVAMTASQKLDFGTVNVNAASRSRVDQEPSGGVKQSGWGKEGPRYAIREMLNTRMITLAQG